MVYNFYIFYYIIDMAEKKKLIKANFPKCSLQMQVEFRIGRVLNINGNVALIGNIDGFEKTNGKINSIYKQIYALRKAGRQVHYYLDRETWYEMRKDPRVSALMSRLGTVIHIVEDWNEFKIEEGMKFTGIVMNPPFNSGLHLKILEKTMESVDWEHDGKVVCIHPAKWLQFPTRERPTFMNGHIKDFTIVDRKEANTTFEIDDGDMVITELGNDGKSFQGTPVDDPEFCCFKFNSRFDI